MSISQSQHCALHLCANVNIMRRMDGAWFQSQLKQAGKTQAELARHLRLNAAAVSRLFKGERQLKLLEAAKIAQFLNAPYDEVVKHAGLYEPEVPLPTHLSLERPGLREAGTAEALRALGFGQRDLPVRGRAEGGPDGAVMLDSEPIDWTWRPPELQGARDAFAMFVTGTSMGDVLPEGSTVYVHPSLPPRPNDFVIVEKKDHEALIKRLVRRTGGTVTLRQYDPVREFDLDRAEIKAIYRVVGTIYP